MPTRKRPVKHPVVPPGDATITVDYQQAKRWKFIGDHYGFEVLIHDGFFNPIVDGVSSNRRVNYHDAERVDCVMPAWLTEIAAKLHPDLFMMVLEEMGSIEAVNSFWRLLGAKSVAQAAADLIHDVTVPPSRRKYR